MSSTRIIVRGLPADGVHGRLRVPGDKSISHRALLLGARADGVSTITGLSGGDDVRHTLAAMADLGADVREDDAGVVELTGGLDRLREPEHLIDVGNSGTGIRLLAGYCSAFPWLTVLQGDASIARRPMDRVAHPLRLMGARIDGRDGGRFPPLVVRGGDLVGIDYSLPVASAQVKAAVLLAGLGADGETVVRESVRTRAHTEEMLAMAGADIDVSDDGLVTRLRPSALKPFTLDVPGDPSQAAFWIVAACIVPGSDLTVEHVYLGPARAAFLDVLVRMGADIEVTRTSTGDNVGDVRARFGPLTATEVAGADVPGVIDEIPILAVAAAVAEGTTVFRDAAELKVKETDRIATVTAELGALGARVTPRPDGLEVEGTGPGSLRAAGVRSHGDHRIAMAGAIAALTAAGETTIEGWEAVATSYPRFEEDLRTCVS